MYPQIALRQETDSGRYLADLHLIAGEDLDSGANTVPSRAIPTSC